MHKKPFCQLSILSFLLATCFLMACKKSTDSSPAILVKEPTTLTLSAARGHLSAAAIANKLVIAGGYKGNNNYSDTVDVFTIGTDGKLATSPEKLKLSAARAFLTATAIANKLVVFAGGFNNNTGYSNAVDVFTIGTDGKLATSQTLTLSEARSGLSAATVDNKLVVFAGGEKGNNNFSNMIDVFTIGTDGKLATLQTLSLSETRGYLSAATIANKLVIAGGVRANGTYSNVVDVFTIGTDGKLATSQTLSLSESRGHLAAAAIGNKLVIAGGSNNSYSTTVDVFTIGTDGKLAKSTESLSLSEAREYLSASTIGNKLVIAGGYNDSYSTAVDVFTIGPDGKLVKSTEKLSLSEARDGLSTAVIGKKLVIAGGEKSSTTYSNVIDIFSLSK